MSFQFLNDTLVRDFVIDERKNGWGVMQGKVRPATSAEVRAYAREAGKLADTSDVSLKAKFIADHIVEWNGGCPVTVENVMRLPLPFWDRIENIITGYDLGDVLGN